MRCSTWLDPEQVTEHPSTCKSLLTNCLQVLVNASYVNARECDRITQEYHQLIDSSNLIQFESFQLRHAVCSSLYFGILNSTCKNKNFHQFVKDLPLFGKKRSWNSINFPCKSHGILFHKRCTNPGSSLYGYGGLCLDGGLDSNSSLSSTWRNFAVLQTYHQRRISYGMLSSNQCQLNGKTSQKKAISS